MLGNTRLWLSVSVAQCVSVSVAYLNPVTLFTGLQAVEARHDDTNKAFVESLVASLQIRFR